MGLDLGIKDFISNGEKLRNEVKVNEKRLKGLQKGLARCWYINLQIKYMKESII